jgi:hypothetical protein
MTPPIFCSLYCHTTGSWPSNRIPSQSNLTQTFSSSFCGTQDDEHLLLSDDELPSSLATQRPQDIQMVWLLFCNSATRSTRYTLHVLEVTACFDHVIFLFLSTLNSCNSDIPSFLSCWRWLDRYVDEYVIQNSWQFILLVDVMNCSFYYWISYYNLKYIMRKDIVINLYRDRFITARTLGFVTRKRTLSDASVRQPLW